MQTVKQLDMIQNSAVMERCRWVIAREQRYERIQSTVLPTKNISPVVRGAWCEVFLVLGM